MKMSLAALAGLSLLAAVPAACAEQSAVEAEGATAPALFVANKRESSLSRLSLESGGETGRVATCSNPHELSLSPDRAHVAVACYDGTAVEIYDAASLERVKTVELGVGARPHGVLWHESGTLLATAEGRGSIFVIADPLSATASPKEIETGAGGPHLLAVSRDPGIAWGTNRRAGEVIRIDLAAGAVTHRAKVEGNPEGIAITPDNSALWVGANTANKVYRLDPDTLEVEGEVPTGVMPIRVQIAPDGARVVTSNARDGTLTVIDAERGEAVRTIAVSGGGEAGQVTLAFSEDGSKLYVAETGADRIAETAFPQGAVIRRMAAGEGGDGLAISE